MSWRSSGLPRGAVGIDAIFPVSCKLSFRIFSRIRNSFGIPRKVGSLYQGVSPVRRLVKRPNVREKIESAIVIYPFSARPSCLLLMERSLSKRPLLEACYTQSLPEHESYSGKV